MNPLSQVFKVKQLSWSEERKPDSQSRYDYCEAKTPFGCFWITWTNYKDIKNYDIVETPWGGYLGSYPTLEQAKTACQVQFEEQLKLCQDQIIQEPPQCVG